MFSSSSRLKILWIHAQQNPHEKGGVWRWPYGYSGGTWRWPAQPPKINSSNLKSWCFGRCFSFSRGPVFSGSMLILPGVFWLQIKDSTPIPSWKHNKFCAPGRCAAMPLPTALRTGIDCSTATHVAHLKSTKWWVEGGGTQGSLAFWEKVISRSSLYTTKHQWGYNPYKRPYKWVTGVMTLLKGVQTPFVTRGPPCRNFSQTFTKQVVVEFACHNQFLCSKWMEDAEAEANKFRVTTTQNNVPLTLWKLLMSQDWSSLTNQVMSRSKSISFHNLLHLQPQRINMKPCQHIPKGAVKKPKECFFWQPLSSIQHPWKENPGVKIWYAKGVSFARGSCSGPQVEAFIPKICWLKLGRNIRYGYDISY